MNIYVKDKFQKNDASVQRAYYKQINFVKVISSSEYELFVKQICNEKVQGVFCSPLWMVNLN